MRPSAEYLKSLVGDTKIQIAELGVADGKNAVVMYYGFNIKRLWLIDSWCQLYNKNVNEWAVDTFRKFDNKRNVVIIKANTLDVVDLLPDNGLDYIYLDDLHSAAHVIKEIEAYSSKVKPGGIIAGHDYDTSLDGRVSAGVDLYVEKKKIKLFTKKLDWWFHND